MPLDKEHTLRVAMTMYSTVEGATVGSFINLVRSVPKLKVELEQGSFVAPARNRQIQNSINEGDDYILFIDSDMVFETADVFKLVETLDNNPKLGAVSGHYVKRDGSNDPICNWVKDGDSGWLESDKQAKKIKKHMKNGDVVPVGVFGAGMLLVSIEAAKKLTQPMFDARYIPVDDVPEYITEDFYFIRKLIEAGYTPAVHFGVLAGHIGRKEYRPEMGD